MTMQALVFRYSLPRFAFAKLVGPAHRAGLPELRPVLSVWKSIPDTGAPGRRLDGGANRALWNLWQRCQASLSRRQL
jgi:hypothetical protein